jgi:hypothetical protein
MLWAYFLYIIHSSVCLQVASDKDCVAAGFTRVREEQTKILAARKEACCCISDLGNVGLPLIPQNSFYFLLHVRFSTICLLRAHKLNHTNLNLEMKGGSCKKWIVEERFKKILIKVVISLFLVFRFDSIEKSI